LRPRDESIESIASCDGFSLLFFGECCKCVRGATPIFDNFGHEAHLLKNNRLILKDLQKT